jgi:hypothetical protein
VTIERVLDRIFDLLTTYTHDSELQAITALPLLPTIYKSPQHQLRFFEPAVLSVAVPWQRFLTLEIIQLYAVISSLNCGSLPSDSFPHSLPYRSDSVAPNVFLTTPLQGTSRKHRFQQFPCCCMRIRCSGCVVY